MQLLPLPAQPSLHTQSKAVGVSTQVAFTSQSSTFCAHSSGVQLLPSPTQSGALHVQVKPVAVSLQLALGSQSSASWAHSSLVQLDAVADPERRVTDAFATAVHIRARGVLIAAAAVALGRARAAVAGPAFDARAVEAFVGVDAVGMLAAVVRALSAFVGHARHPVADEALVARARVAVVRRRRRAVRVIVARALVGAGIAAFADRAGRPAAVVSRGVADLAKHGGVAGTVDDAFAVDQAALTRRIVAAGRRFARLAAFAPAAQKAAVRITARTCILYGTLVRDRHSRVGFSRSAQGETEPKRQMAGAEQPTRY